MRVSATPPEPHEWWYGHEARDGGGRPEAPGGATCLDCGKCRRCERHPDTGFCLEDGEFRYADDIPAELGMECFEEAA